MDTENNLQIRRGDKLSAVVAGFYTWVVTISFGALLLDVVYATQAPRAASSEAADFLLLLTAIVAIAAIPAIAVSWGTRTARYLFIASLMIIMLEFLIPALFAPLLQGLAIGTAVRVVIGASASILAFVGLNRLCL